MKKIDELRQELNAKKEEARGLLKSDKVNEAEAKMPEIRALETKIKLQSELDEAEERKVQTKLENRKDENMLENNEVVKNFEVTKRASFNTEETRAVLLSSGTLIKPTKTSNNINGTFNEVSSIVDMVNVQDCAGMGSYLVPYVVSTPTGGVKGENTAYQSGDTTFAYATIAPCKVTTFSKLSTEVTKLTSADYYAKVKQCALIALRKKVSELIAKGNPSAVPAEITGIINENASAISSTAKIDVSTIDEKTLRKIALSYGGNENVVGNAVLFLNKVDLITFGDVRGSDKKPVYEITPDTNNPNTGIIKDGGLSVRYCLNSNLAALSATGTAEDTYCMVYGQPQNYELGLFSNYEIKVSEDFEFEKGMLSVRGEVMIGGNVTHADGFVLVKKMAA